MVEAFTKPKQLRIDAALPWRCSDGETGVYPFRLTGLDLNLLIWSLVGWSTDLCGVGVGGGGGGGGRGLSEVEGLTR